MPASNDTDEIVSPMPTKVLGFSTKIVGTALIRKSSYSQTPFSNNSGLQILVASEFSSFKPISETPIPWAKVKWSYCVYSPLYALLEETTAAVIIPFMFWEGVYLKFLSWIVIYNPNMCNCMRWGFNVFIKYNKASNKFIVKRRK